MYFSVVRMTTLGVLYKPFLLLPYIEIGEVYKI